MSKRERHKCAECDEEGIAAFEDGKWLCTVHGNERINAPWNIAAMEAYEAEEELAEFRDGGGKLS